MRHYATSCKAWQVDVLLKSLRRHCQPFTLHVLAWDWIPEAKAWGIPGVAQVETTTRAELCAKHPHLRELPGPPRTPIEEACSVRWRWFADTVAKVWESDGGSLMCVDGDCWFWSDPELVWRALELQPRTWALTEHRFPYPHPGVQGATIDSHIRYGRFNGGWAWFRDLGPALDVAALTEAWCRGTFLDFDDKPYFGDQGALERIDDVVPAHVMDHPGVNLAPWNLWRYSVAARPGGEVLVSEPDGWGAPLVLYHYSSLRVDERGVVRQLADEGYALQQYHADLLYRPYVSAIGEVMGR